MLIFKVWLMFTHILFFSCQSIFFLPSWIDCFRMRKSPDFLSKNWLLSWFFFIILHITLPKFCSVKYTARKLTKYLLQTHPWSFLPVLNPLEVLTESWNFRVEEILESKFQHPIRQLNFLYSIPRYLLFGLFWTYPRIHWESESNPFLYYF